MPRVQIINYGIKSRQNGAQGVKTRFAVYSRVVPLIAAIFSPSKPVKRRWMASARGDTAQVRQARGAAPGAPEVQQGSGPPRNAKTARGRSGGSGQAGMLGSGRPVGTRAEPKADPGRIRGREERESPSRPGREHEGKSLDACAAESRWRVAGESLAPRGESRRTVSGKSHGKVAARVANTFQRVVALLLDRVALPISPDP